MPARMHTDELDIDVALVRRLLRTQHPRWAELPLERVPSSGTDHAMFRLGPERVVRLPRIGWAAPALGKEHRWLPVLAPQLPLLTPVLLARGEPGEGYPWPWSIYRWLDGRDASVDRPADLARAARDLAGFIAALQAIDTTGAPVRVAGQRGAALATVDDQTRRAIAAARGLVDVEAVTSAWDAALSVPTWDRRPVWFHGDIASGNLIVRDGRIAAVIDFSGIGAGDPACDLVVAWELLDAPSRDVLRAGLDLDDAMWARGRGWALCTALWALPYYLHTNPPMVAQARRKIGAVLADRA